MQYSEAATPYLQQITPLGLLSGETIKLSGLFRADKFGDADDPPDDVDSDFFLRILAGGTLCDHYTEDGEE